MVKLSSNLNMPDCLRLGTVLDPCSHPVSTPDLTLNIKPLLAMIPATEQDTEYEQVRLCFKISPWFYL